jgi:CheY-like chemotaxis protein
VLLIVEDDLNFARVLLDIANAKGFKGLIALRGDAALPLAHHYRPAAITLDIRLPDQDGWTVLNALKDDRLTRHIPVHIISGDEEHERAIQQGAFAFLTKPVSKEALDQVLADVTDAVKRRPKHLLVVEDDEAQRTSIIALIDEVDVRTTAVGTGAAALAALQAEHVDGVILDLGLPDMTGQQLIEEIRKLPDLSDLPIIVHTGRELTRKEEADLKRVSETIVVKGVHSPERLADETALFLHRVAAQLPVREERALERLQQADGTLAGKKVLLVDDDMRNIFALTSLLEGYNMEIVPAENGNEAIELLQSTPGVDIVLMDIMMPELDGYDTMRAIRQIRRFKTLPIIALTAKAMKGDREKCIEAGASDYITKPVNTEQLLSLLRVWLYRQGEQST